MERARESRYERKRPVLERAVGTEEEEDMSVLCLAGYDM